MRGSWLGSLVLVIFLVVASSTALAGPLSLGLKPKPPKPRAGVPEIDPSAWSAIAALAVGGTALVSSRRRRAG